MSLRRPAACTLGLSLSLCLGTLSAPAGAEPRDAGAPPSVAVAPPPEGSTAAPARAPLELPARSDAHSWLVPVRQGLTLRPLALEQPLAQGSVQAQLDAIDARLDELADERSQYSLGGPIGLMAGGGGVLLVSAYVLFLNWVNSETCSYESYDYSSSDSSYRTETDDSACWNHDKVGTLSVAGLFAGGGMILGGGLWLGDRVSSRRELGEEIQTLRRKRQRLEQAPAGHSSPRDEFGALRPGFDRAGARMLRVTFEF